jgi:diguanylate cyclase (GGDEF)-like protein/PAS domain S-box-containing protein
MKLLIVDDHDINVRLLRAQLEADGHDVLQACDGVEALEVLDREAVDGLISDILMPRMDGYRLCMEIRSRAATARLPFVLYTATYNSPADLDLAHAIGADAYIAKPAPTARLIEALLAAASKQAIAGDEGTLLPVPEPPPMMKHYNEVLIRKLEEKGVELERTHEGLLETKARLTALIATAMDAIIAVDESRRVVLFNAAAGRMFRCDPEGALGRPLNDFIPHGSRETHDRHMAAFALETDVSRSMGPREVSALRTDGSVFPIEANISHVPTSQGQLFTVFIRDVTDRHDAQARLRESEAGLRRAQEVAQLGHAVVNAEGDVESRSSSFAGMLGVADDAVPSTVAEWLAHVHEDDLAAVKRSVEQARTYRRRVDVEYRMRRGNEWRRIRQILEPLEPRADAGQLRTFSTFQDVTAQRHTEERIRQLNRVYAVLSDINSLIVHAADREELFQQACRIAVETGRFAKAWIGLVDDSCPPVRIVAWAGAEDAYFEDLQNRFASNAANRRGVLARALDLGKSMICNDIANDEMVVERKKLVDSGSLSFALLPLTINARVIGVISLHAPTVGFFDAEETELLLRLANDIAFALDHLLKAERIHFLAHHDALTGLPNRLRFSQLVTQRIAAGTRTGKLGCVALIDLVRFRRINETLGRRAGDDLLIDISARLQQRDDSVARVGPDVFAVHIDDVGSAAELARHLEYVTGECFARPFTISGEEVRVGCRIGVAVSPGDGDDAEHLLRSAEVALRRARAVAEHVVFYASDMNVAVNEALLLESKLRRAIERDEFVLHYQPKVRLTDRTIVGVEALIRWQDPESGLVLPKRFIPVLEETGLIADVGRSVIRRALDDAERWQSAGARSLCVAVNVSPLQMNQPNFAAHIAALLAEAPTGGLEIEITESVIMTDVDRKISVLDELRRLGVRIAIDDFGTGYSSLAYISRLPITSLKIDRAFVTDMTASAQGYILVSSIIALAHALGLKVVAEGVETEEQAHLLHLLHCDEAQGYLFSRPLPADALLELVHADRALP